MISALVLERPGRWRTATIAFVFLAALLPTFPLLWAASEAGPGVAGVGGSPFVFAVARSVGVAVPVAAIAIALGMPLGLMAGLYDFFARRTLIALFALPLLVPTFLWAIGLSQLRIFLGLPSDGFLSGWRGTTIAFTAFAVPLVFFMTLLSTRALSRNQVEAARMAAGEPWVLNNAFVSAFPGALLAAVLAAVLTLSDPGPGQILGHTGAPYEILLSFSALYDFPLAARQCAFLTGVVLVFAAPAALWLAPKIAVGVFGRDILPAPLAQDKTIGRVSLISMVLFLLLAMGFPLFGLTRSLLASFPLERAFPGSGSDFR